MKTLYFFVFIIANTSLAAQADTIRVGKFANSSFEEALLSIYKTSEFGHHYQEDSIPHWQNEGIQGATPPDLHILNQNKWGVTQTPADGEKYVGLVTRFHESYEGISQKLKRALHEHQEYMFTLQVCTFAEYEMQEAPIPEGNQQPIVLRVWGKYSKREMEWQELFTSSPIQNIDWEKLTVSFMPVSQIDHIKIGAYWEEGVLFPHNGNILIDDLSPIYLLEYD